MRAVAISDRGNGRPTSTATDQAATPRPPTEPAIPPVPFEHEELAIRRGPRSGAYCIVAIHSTALGPALGGIRMWRYPTTIDGVRDALRLGAGMTYKAAAAGLDFGGGKGVICAPVEGLPDERRRAALLDFGDLVESLGGRYIAAEDVGISPSDLVAIGERTSHLTGLPPEQGGSGDPSPFTAIGVEAAIRACLKARFRDARFAGRRVAVVGLGRVGASLARRLAGLGCKLLISDIDPAKRALASALEASWVDPDVAMEVECDVLAPCAMGGAVTARSAPRLHCEIICGSANNQLADDALAGALSELGILYAPDFIVNAGGLIHVCMEITGYSEARAIGLAEGIEDTVANILALAECRGVSPLTAARDLARKRLDTALRN